MWEKEDFGDLTPNPVVTFECKRHIEWWSLNYQEREEQVHHILILLFELFYEIGCDPATIEFYVAFLHDMVSNTMHFHNEIYRENIGGIIDVPSYV